MNKNNGGVLECEALDTLFIQSEQAVTEGLITKKYVMKNAYYGKVPDGEQFPLGSGTRIKGYRLGRVGVPDDAGWRPVVDELCETNACAFEPEVISHGSSDFFFSLCQRDLRTDWVCLDSLALREMPESELAHLEEGLQNAARYVHEEFRRSRYLNMGRNKLLALVGLDGEDLPVVEFDSCDGSEMISNAYIFETRPDGEMDEGHIRVCCTVAQIPQISELTMDMLDYAQQRLEYEDQTYLDGTSLHDVVLADRRQARKIVTAEVKALNDATGSNESYNMVDLHQAYGTERVIGNYSMRTDIHAMRFYPDTEFNATLEAFDASDANTWPRFKRVYAYIPVKAQLMGIEYVTNPDYLNAPFGISTILTPRVMSVMSFPNVVKVGNAQKVGGFGYDGTAQWQNPDWTCNVNRDKGFWKMRFRMAAKQNRDEEGYSWFTRINTGKRFRGNQCSIPEAACHEAATPYCFEGMGGLVDSGFGVNAAVGN